MRRLNNFPDRFIDDGDWHSCLLAALNRAEKESSSSGLLLFIPAIREILLENDECLHQVTLTKKLPCDMNYEHVCQYLEEVGSGKEMSIQLINNTTISLTLTMRGSITYVSLWANNILNEGLSWARREIFIQRGAKVRASKCSK